jgi:hypothetical protein
VAKALQIDPCLRQLASATEIQHDYQRNAQEADHAEHQRSRQGAGQSMACQGAAD